MTEPAAPARWSGHVIVCGLHDEGLRIVEQLHSSGVPVVVVDDAPDPRLVRSLEALGVPYLAADSRQPETLAVACLATATALVCVESEDLHTLATALLARELRPDLRVVVQLRNAAVGRALAAVGVAVLDVARLSTPSIVEACLRTGAWTLDLGPTTFRVVEARVSAEGTLRELYGDLAPLAVVLADGRTVLTPGRDTRWVPATPWSWSARRPRWWRPGWGSAAGPGRRRPSSVRAHRVSPRPGGRGGRCCATWPATSTGGSSSPSWRWSGSSGCR